MQDNIKFAHFFLPGLVTEMTNLPHVRAICEVEMIARTLKPIFKSRLRSAIKQFKKLAASKAQEEIEIVAVNFFSGVLSLTESASKARVASISLPGRC